jgi:hypothetical protein
MSPARRAAARGIPTLLLKRPRRLSPLPRGSMTRWLRSTHYDPRGSHCAGIQISCGWPQHAAALEAPPALTEVALM